jgi:hypothetical protein
LSPGRDMSVPGCFIREWKEFCSSLFIIYESFCHSFHDAKLSNSLSFYFVLKVFVCFVSVTQFAVVPPFPTLFVQVLSSFHCETLRLSVYSFQRFEAPKLLYFLQETVLVRSFFYTISSSVRCCFRDLLFVASRMHFVC